MDATSVLAPLFAVLGVAGIFIFVEYKRAGHAPVNAGSMFATVVVLYAAFPLLIYQGLGGFYTPLNDSRLFSDQPDPATIARIAWYYVAYLTAFVVGYLAMNGRRGGRVGVSIPSLDAPTMWSLVAAYVALRVSVLAAEVLFAARSTDYLESYLKYKHLPLVAQQLLGHAEGIAAVLGLGVMAMLCSRWQRYRVLVACWLALEFGTLLLGLGARTQFVTLCLAAAISYHFLYKRLSMTALAGAGVAVIVLFLGLGLIRQYVGYGGVAGVGTEALAGSSEFESLFANAYDVDRLVTVGGIDKSSIRAAVYLGDVINLVPQQLSPFEKISLPTWYVETYYPEHAERGGGLAFGAVPEALVGTGLFDLLWRAALVGIALCWFDRSCRTGSVAFWRFVLQVWLISFCYLTFRSTTLALLPLFVYRFLPAMMGVAALAWLIRFAATDSPQSALFSDELHSSR
jgi:hypothetical protein